MTTISLKVIVEEAYIDEADNVVRRIEELGVHVESRMPEIGVVFGSGDDSLLPKLREVEGVREAEPEATYRTPPMSDDVPQ